MPLLVVISLIRLIRPILWSIQARELTTRLREATNLRPYLAPIRFTNEADLYRSPRDESSPIFVVVMFYGIDRTRVGQW